MTVQPTRYLLARDDDGHWYLMPETNHEAFERWIYEEGDEPATVVRLAGSPSNVTFEAPLEFGKPIAEPAADHHARLATGTPSHLFGADAHGQPGYGQFPDSCGWPNEQCIGHAPRLAAGTEG